MATAIAPRRARVPQRKEVKQFTFLWEGFDRSNRNVRGEKQAASETALTINSKIKSALFYPISVVVVAIVVIWVIMIWVIPAFKQVFTSFGANLPAPTLIVMSISDFFVSYWWLIAAIVGGTIFGFFFMLRR